MSAGRPMILSLFKSSVMLTMDGWMDVCEIKPGLSDCLAQSKNHPGRILGEM